MARPSYGPEAKKRSRRLLEVLLAYANDAIACEDEASLESLRPQIQTRWLSENRLVVRTKVRFLQALTALTPGEGQLNAEQIKEALKRFADFLEILEDNRPSRGGSETWHFTLNLWHKRQDTEANLQKFDSEWESRRPEKSKQVVGGEGLGDKQTGGRGEGGESSPSSSSSTSPSPSSLNWKELCCHALKAQNHQLLTTNPLTSADGVSFELNQVYVPLGLVERKHRLRHDDDVNPQEGSRLYESEDVDITQTFNHDQFLQELLREQQSQRIAIVGEPGAGKTTLLQKIAAWVLDNTEDLPIWISLADLQGKTIEQYLIQDWLPAAIRKLRVPEEIEEELCEQFNQGRVWLLLDAVDEMALESSQALTKIASCLSGWVGDANVILTCRLNVWDGGKNALQSFITYRNLNFSYSSQASCNQVGQFIRRWFQNNPACAESLQAELDQPERRRLKDAVKNPLRLALLCRTWGLTQGRLPTTKFMLYEQFVEVIYEWKQDRFPTTLAQRQQLNRALGELALLAIDQEKTKFRLRHRFVCQVLGCSDDGLFQLALQLGWLNQVGISQTQGEKVYAFYHPTFQEYFAAQAVNDWHFFCNHTLDTPSYRIFSTQWREVILLWLGRDDIPQVEKEEFIQALIKFDDDCGGYYSYQAYFIAAQGIAEFPDCRKADEIVQQLVEWRFGYCQNQDQNKNQKPYRYPPPIVECARVALLKTDRPKAIAALENFIKSSDNQFDTWNAAYSLGKVFDPGNKIAIAALEKLVKTVRHESIRWQAAYSLGRVDADNQIAIAALIQIIESTKNESTCRKAAYSLGKITPQNGIAISTLKKIAASGIDASQRQQALGNLAVLDGNELSNSHNQTEHPLGWQQHQRSQRKKQSTSLNHYSINFKITELIASIASSSDEDTQRRRAYKLAQLDPGNAIALKTLLELIQSTQSVKLRKNIADNLKEILLNEQLPEVVASLKNIYGGQFPSHKLENYRDCYKLIWHCAENMDYLEFYRIWHQ
jgi:predicted NACHT family NTPase